MPRSLGLLACLLTALVSAQGDWRDTLALRMRDLNSIVARADTLTIDEVMEDDWSINSELGEALISVLEVPGLSDHDIDSLFPVTYFRPVRSDDGRLWIFNWDERTGGSFQAEVSVVFARTRNGEVRASYHTASEDDWCVGAAYTAIHRLRSTNGSALYACIGDVRGCTTCCASVINVLEITQDGVNFGYPAFPAPANAGKEDVPAEQPSSTWVLDARCGDITRFVYDPRKQVLSYAYLPDDLTPLRANDPAPEVSGRLRFSGEAFVGK